MSKKTMAAIFAAVAGLDPDMQLTTNEVASAVLDDEARRKRKLAAAEAKRRRRAEKRLALRERSDLAFRAYHLNEAETKRFDEIVHPPYLCNMGWMVESGDDR